MADEYYEGCIGIDLGTTYSCVGIWENGKVTIIPNEIGSRTTPSWVAFTDTDRLIGESAKAQLHNNTANTVYDVKRLIGRKYSDKAIQEIMETFGFNVTPDANDLPIINVTWKGEAKRFRPEEISAMILAKMKEIAENYLGKKVKNAVITVPAYFTDSQRNATKSAATIAGLNCVRTINEPTSACLCYGLDKILSQNQTVMIFDFGGGTLDVSVMSLIGGIFEVLGISGNSNLGGEDLDQGLMDWVIEQFIAKHGIDPSENQKAMKKLKTACETAKRHLSTSMTTLIEIDSFYEGIDVSQKITRAQFEAISSKIFRKCMDPVEKVLGDLHMSKNDIDEIILIGGSTRIPKIQEMLRTYFNGKELNKSVNPDEAVAYGAAIQGAILTDTDSTGKVKDILLLDVIPLSLGIETSGGIMSVLIDRNTTVPTNKSKIYSTIEDNQECVMVKVFEGERKFTKDNNMLGTFELSDIPKLPRGVPKIEVQFDVDSNGILNVSAIELSTGHSAQVTISNDSGRLSQEEINKMIEDAETYKAEDEMKKLSIDTMNMFEKYLYSIQISINDAQMNINLTADEVSTVNQYLLNTFDWIRDNEFVNHEIIKEVRKQVEYNLQPYMYQIYAHKEAIEQQQQQSSSGVILNSESSQTITNISDGTIDLNAIVNNIIGSSAENDENNNNASETPVVAETSNEVQIDSVPIQQETVTEIRSSIELGFKIDKHTAEVSADCSANDAVIIHDTPVNDINKTPVAKYIVTSKNKKQNKPRIICK